jgi:hypothetical protein
MMLSRNVVACEGITLFQAFPHCLGMTTDAPQPTLAPICSFPKGQQNIAFGVALRVEETMG